jgi:hypothetical protein
MSWEAGVEAFLKQTALYINEDKDRASLYRDKLQEKAEKGKTIAIKRDLAAKNILQLTSKAEGLGATPGMIASALSSGAKGILDLTEKMQSIKNEFTSEGFEWNQEAKDQAALKVELPELYKDFERPASGWQSLVDKYYKKGAGTVGDYQAENQSWFGKALGRNAKDYIRQELDAETKYAGISTYDLSQLDGTPAYDIGEDTAGFVSWGDLNLFGETAFRNLNTMNNQSLTTLNKDVEFQKIKNYIDTPKESPYFNTLSRERESNEALFPDDERYKLDPLWTNRAVVKTRKFYDDQVNNKVANQLRPNILATLQKYGAVKTFGNNPALVTSINATTYPGFVESIVAEAGYENVFSTSSSTSTQDRPSEEVKFDLETVLGFQTLNFSIASGDDLTRGAVPNVFNLLGGLEPEQQDKLETKAEKTAEGYHKFYINSSAENSNNISVEFDPVTNDVIDFDILRPDGTQEDVPEERWKAVFKEQPILRILGLAETDDTKIIKPVVDPDVVPIAPTFATDDINAAIAVLGSNLDIYKNADGKFDVVKIANKIKGWTSGSSSSQALKDALGTPVGFGKRPKMQAFVNSIIESLGGTVDVSSNDTDGEVKLASSEVSEGILEKLKNSLSLKAAASTNPELQKELANAGVNFDTSIEEDAVTAANNTFEADSAVVENSTEKAFGGSSTADNAFITNATRERMAKKALVTDAIISSAHSETVINLDESLSEVSDLTGGEDATTQVDLSEDDIEAILGIQNNVIEKQVSLGNLDVTEPAVKALVTDAFDKKVVLSKLTLEKFNLYDAISSIISGETDKTEENAFGGSSAADNPYITDATRARMAKEALATEVTPTIDDDLRRDMAREPAELANLLAAVRAGDLEEANLLAQQIEESRNVQTGFTAPEPKKVTEKVDQQGAVSMDISSPTFDENKPGLMSPPSVKTSEEDLPSFSSLKGLASRDINVDTDLRGASAEPDAYEDPEISVIVDAVQEAVKPKSTLGRVKPNKLKVTNSQLRNAIVKALGGNNELPKDRKEQKALIDSIAKVYISRRIEEVSE